ncbi:MAG: UDP-N-acetylmuramoyl-L-alanyl-D-glutamate--2,6-diaminopimelate ligase, partial [Actinomycetota bacterium]
ERGHDVSIPHIVVEDARVAMPWAARAVFGMPDVSMQMVGVTGTNGKTTVTHMLESILISSGTPVGIIGTVGVRINGRAMATSRTTPEATDLQRILGMMRDDAVRVVLMEVSSHAIELHRTDAISFSVMGFTNLTRDHLDFHGDMDSYFATKKSVFVPEVSETAVVNVDDEWGRRLNTSLEIPAQTVALTGRADLHAADLVGGTDGTTFTAVTPQGAIDIHLPLVGDFNVANALVAIGLARELGVESSAIAEGLGRLAPIPGRMEAIPHDGAFTVVVDYAHTPDAIAVVLDSVRSAVSGRVMVIIGAGGDRDREKRSLMGAAAARRSDLTIITTDNPRSEDPGAIADEVRRGAEAQPGANIEMIPDRRAAIARAVESAEPGDMVLVLGKGHEQGQDVGSAVLPFDDRLAVRDALTAAGRVPE